MEFLSKLSSPVASNSNDFLSRGLAWSDVAWWMDCCHRRWQTQCSVWAHASGNWPFGFIFMTPPFTSASNSYRGLLSVYYRGRFRQVALHLHCIWVPYLGISSHCSDFSFFNFSLLDNGNFMYNRPCSIAYLFFCWLYCYAGDRNWSRSSHHKVAFIAEGVPLAKWIVIDNLFKWGCSTIKIRSYVVPFMTGLEILHEDFWNLGL